MSEGRTQSTDGVGSSADATRDEIARSLGSIWRRFSGHRPLSTSVEIDQNVIRCVIEEGSPDAESDEDGESTDPLLSQAGLKQEATAAVTRLTGRRVVGFIPKSPKQSESSTQTFVLERPRERF
jgi:hypothetical protein